MKSLLSRGRATSSAAALFVAISLPPLLRSAETVTPGAAVVAADEDWDKVEQLHNAAKLHPELNFSRLHPRPEAGNQVDQNRWIFEWFKLAMPVTREFAEKHPTDPRRWNGIVSLRNGYSIWADALPAQPSAVIAAVDEIMNPTERATYLAQLNQWTDAMRQATDVSPDDRFLLEVWPIRQRIANSGMRKLPADAPEWTEIRKQLEQLGGQYPKAKTTGLVRMYQANRAPYGTDPKSSHDDLVALSTVANADIANEATLALQNIELAAQPLKFTAVDGRSVDVTKLKGKVVLVDFWATWCGPCKAELPNVVANYRKYHDRGFEIVSVSLENAKFTADDTPEKTEQKLAAAKKVLEDFTAAHDMPWPQYFDGTYWKNPIVTRYGINSIPAMFLLDQNGQVVSTNARGPVLEAELKRLLKL